MKRVLKVELRKLIASSISATVIIIALSISFGLIPALGDFLFPGRGVWSVPDEISNSETITTSAINSDVIVYRDEWGIPHIYGSSEEDIMYALGYIHAQDRLFQMDMARRLTRGQMSEILGPEYIETDKFNLNMLKDYYSNEILNYLKQTSDPELKYLYQLLLKYCEGVNYYIDTHLNSLPLEFQFLGYTPKHWEPIDSLAFAKYMAEMLTWNYNDFYAIKLRTLLGAQNYSDLIDAPLDYQIPICPDYGNYSDISPPYSQLNANNNLPLGQQGDATIGYNDDNIEDSSNMDAQYVSRMISAFLNDILKIPQETERITIQQNNAIGSNNWVINGSKSATGFPILCNDMHLAYGIPGIWYETHIIDTSSNWNFYGFFLAGVSVPIVGHNSYVAWGFTNTGYDVLDWYYYNTIDNDHYLYKGSILEYGKINYTINVKGQSPVHFTVKTTVHGPVFNDFLSEKFLNDFPDNTIACKWIAQNITFELKALYGYSKAENRSSFDKASKYFHCPAQNTIYADIHGNIGIRPTGLVPIRNDTDLPSWHAGNGTMPYNGSKGEGEWIGYIPFEDLPHSENPTQGYLTSANQIIAGPDYLKNYSLQHPLSIAPGYRARRINELLALNDDITVEDMKSFQLDVYSVLAGNVTPILVNVLQNLSNKTQIQNDVMIILQNWNYKMDKKLAAPTIFHVWYEIYKEYTFKDEFDALGIGDLLPNDAVLEKLTRENETAEWFNNISTPAVESRNETILAALNTALNALTNYFGTANPSQWRWELIHFVEFPHITGLSSLGFGPYPVNGSGRTINPKAVKLWKNGEIKPGISKWGASERLIVDFSDLNKTLSVIPSGERGISTSKHYSDQLELYLQGKYHPQYFGATTPQLFQQQWIESQILFKSARG
ncbi:MAG: penicillin acylase family protein [Promethearchaeota archaeon]